MLEYTKIFIILMILFLSAGCFVHTFASISDCERIKDSTKRDECFVRFVEEVPASNTGLRIGICEKLVGAELRDACFFKTAQDGWRFMSSDNLSTLCSKIGSDILGNSCYGILNRPHLQAVH